ncbi:hypothetical protein NLU13_1655 [Sarocladium strictum]|uniref:Uncharacterized protein n=1 Tax=Sarocladium strictum TaxID=5046 RepID=A0AA39GU64_SARSR|nr:hypothetical protein NLU13_1655 [Sarocladium strictum]
MFQSPPRRQSYGSGERRASIGQSIRHQRPRLLRASVTEPSLTTCEGDMQGALAGPLTSERAADLLSRVVDAPSHGGPSVVLPQPKVEVHDRKAEANTGFSSPTQDRSTSTDPMPPGPFYFSFPSLEK